MMGTSWLGVACVLASAVPRARGYCASCRAVARRPPSLGLARWEAPSRRHEASRLGAAAGLDEASVSGGGLLGALYKFSRPHTMRGTLLASIAGVAKALAVAGGLSAAWQWELLPRAIAGAIALVCANAWIVGINQIYDVDVDKINKPFLPIAAGELSPKTAWLLLAACAATGPAIVATVFSPLIFGLYLFGTLVGTAYSVPPLKLKSRGPVFAGVSIAVCRGFLLNFGVYYATLEALGIAFQWSPPVAFMARFMTVFAAVIAVTKDLPDVAGDAKFKVKTLATRFGPNKVAHAAAAVLALNYLSALLHAALAPRGAFNLAPMLGGHLVLLGLLLRHLSRYRRYAPADLVPALKVFYKHVWDLFYLEYALYIFI
mmetsp:Transcript_14235/g.44919  ORF Transcript_14235/g.44919 Transcript_14235/m.44919 type:complete len:374 (-) Transcript_14235:337-1458(-)